MRRSRFEPAYRAALALALVAAGILPHRPARASEFGVVDGLVVSDDGHVVGYAIVVLVGQRTGALTDENGRFRIAAWMTGRWQLRVICRGYATLADSFVVAADDTVRRTFRLIRLRPTGDRVAVPDPWRGSLAPLLEARLRNAREARVLRLDPMHARDSLPADTVHFVRVWPIVDEAGPVRGWIDSLRVAVRGADYRPRAPGTVKPCQGFQPGIAVRFAGGGPTTDLLICYRCGEISLLGHDGLEQAGEFGPQGPLFVRFAKAMFPKDAEIRSLGTPVGD